MNVFSKPAGFAAFIWRLILTTGTGSLFGFLVARQAYDTALLAPMFIIISFAFGLAVYIPVLMAAYRLTERPLGDAVLQRLKNLLIVFIGATLYFVFVYYLTNLYFTKQHGFVRFILLDGGIYPLLFWGGQIALGGVLPLLLLAHPVTGKCRSVIAFSSLCVIAGGIAQMYVFIIGGQAYPLEIFPGYTVTASSFYDGAVYHHYTPSLPEILLGLGGFAVAGIMVTIAIKFLRFLPLTLETPPADEDTDAAKSAQLAS